MVGVQSPSASAMLWCVMWLSIVAALLAQAPVADRPVEALTQTFLLANESFGRRQLTAALLTADEPVARERGSVAWNVGGVAGGLLIGAFALAVVGEQVGNAVANSSDPSVNDRRRTGFAIGGAAVGAVGGGLGGWLLGNWARDGSFGARIAVIALDVVGSILWLGAVALVLASAGSFIPN